jgi:hypothetical protein
MPQPVSLAGLFFGGGTISRIKSLFRGGGFRMQHIQTTLEALRRYVASKPDRADFYSIDTLIAVALSELRHLSAERAVAARHDREPARVSSEGAR